MVARTPYGIEIAENEDIVAQLLPGFGHIVFLVDAQRIGTALVHHLDNHVGGAADVVDAGDTDRLKDPGEIRLDKGLPHARRQQIRAGAHLPDGDEIHARAIRNVCRARW